MWHVNASPSPMALLHLVCVMANSCVTHSHVTWLVHMWHDSFTWDMTHSHGTRLIHMWLIHMWDTPLGKALSTLLLQVVRDLWHDSFMCRSFTCDMTHSCVTRLLVTWLIHVWLVHVCHGSFMCETRHWDRHCQRHYYGVATVSRLLKIIGLFCKRALWKRLYAAKEIYNFKEPTNRSHPIDRVFCDMAHADGGQDSRYSSRDVTWPIEVWHDWFKYVTWLKRLTQRRVTWLELFILRRDTTHGGVPWLIQMCHIRCVTWFRCVTWPRCVMWPKLLMQTWDTTTHATHFETWHDSLRCALTDSDVRHDSWIQMCAMRHRGVTWLKLRILQQRVWNKSLRRDTTQTISWHDAFTCVTWLKLCVTRLMGSARTHKVRRDVPHHFNYWCVLDKTSILCICIHTHTHIHTHPYK